MIIKWLGHSAFQIITEHNLKILIDPFISNNPSCPVKVEEVQADIILVTHGHQDHFGDTMEIANRTGAVVVSNHEHSVYLSQQGFDSWGMNIGGNIKFQDINITMVNATHSSDMDFIEEIGAGGSSCGFIIKLENDRIIYHSGDTGLYGDMRTIIRDIYHPEIALIPIGDRFTMGLMEATIAVEWIEPEIVIPMHYNTYPIIEQNPLEFTEMVESLNTGTKVVILEPGEYYEE
ncbi:MAG: metal-dependent hydrolase [Methanobacterium sp.]|nr:metal-dependent hydrolase [Methanobacterium sp.]